jgi:hypothetical protein
MPASAHTAMPVHSLRLPSQLLQRLENLRIHVNKDRAEALNLSSVIRSVLEQALAAGIRPNPESQIIRPARVYRERAANLARLQALDEGPKVFQKASELIELHEITPPVFARNIGGNITEAQRFFHSGQLPGQDPKCFIERVKAWIKTMQEG